MNKFYWFVIYEIKERIYYAVVGLDDLRETTDEYRKDIKNQCALDYNYCLDLDIDSERNYTEHIQPHDVFIWYVHRLYFDSKIDMKFINCLSNMPIG